MLRRILNYVWGYPMLTTPLSTAKKLLIHQEGLKLKPYRDIRGILTIGVGRNLETSGIRESEALNMLANDIVDKYGYSTSCIICSDNCSSRFARGVGNSGIFYSS